MGMIFGLWDVPLLEIENPNYLINSKRQVTTLHDKTIREALEFLDTGKLSAGFVDTIYFTSLNGTIVVKSCVSPSEYKK